MISISFPSGTKGLGVASIVLKRCSAVPTSDAEQFVQRIQKRKEHKQYLTCWNSPLKYIFRHVNAKKEGYMWERWYSTVSLHSISQGPLWHSFWEGLHQKQHRASFKSYISIYNISWVLQ